ncbi:NACHT domain-containing protein [Pseudoalteromonas maricaloris]|uniref:Uncharacterized protein n=1 Tax=Pseudoalteromonas maricaloris TaxID=184924 RepID=A0A8I2KS11_9GAMM|nr:hypothetical protein [Pseudoalteromonas maricaloris]NLR23212.1 hypothetical protein [Pseudoalteromonas maricaloris]WOX29111.1 hypothetical protein R5H13_02235 [Pseudoalteromonas maricaloris]
MSKGRVFNWDRRVRRLDVNNPDSFDKDTCYFSDFIQNKHVVLLGSPGSGKSHLFEHVARFKESSVTRVASFLNKPASRLGDNIFLDGLDESRAGADGAILGQIVQKLYELEPEHFLLSCRESDWYGNVDLDILNDYFEKDVVVLRLEPLDHFEQASILNGLNIDIGIQEFFEKSETHGLTGLLENPQTLIMLAESVAVEGWPKTKKELFESTVTLLLREPNKMASTKQLGRFVPQELVDTAGAIFSCRLLSDVEGFAINESHNNLAPSIRSLTEFDTIDVDKTTAILSRRLCANSDIEGVFDYCHRTIAEFVAAKWISKQLDKGLPIGRVLSIVGLNGFPTSELRGLFAWLVVFQPNIAEQLIIKDPYGVLTYGDPASLSESNKLILLDALAEHSERNPWFRNTYWDEPNIGGLISARLVPKLESILLNKQSAFQLRALIFDALEQSEPIPALLDTYKQVVDSSDFRIRDKESAIVLLSKLAEPPYQFVQTIYKRLLTQSDELSLRVRVKLISSFFGSVFTWKDIARLLDSLSDYGGEVAIGEFWCLVDLASDQEAVLLLNSFPSNDDENIYSPEHRESHSELQYLHNSWFNQVLKSEACFSGKELLNWLVRARALRRGFTSRWAKENNSLLKKQKHKLKEAFRFLLLDDTTENPLHSRVNRFRMDFPEFLSDEEQLSEAMVALSNCPTELTEDIYRIAFKLCFLQPGKNVDKFTYLIDLPKNSNCQYLQPIADQELSCEVEDWRYEDIAQSLRFEAKHNKTRECNLNKFEIEKDLIRNGEHLGHLGWLAHLYFGRYSNIPECRLDAPSSILSAYFEGRDFTYVLEGFKALSDKTNLFDLDYIIQLTKEGKSARMLDAILAGLYELWRETKSISAWSLDKRKMALILDSFCSKPQFKKKEHISRGWLQAILSDNPQLAVKTYYEYMSAEIKSGFQYLRAQQIFLQSKELRLFRKDVIIKLLKMDSSKAYAQNFWYGALRDGVEPDELNSILVDILENAKELPDEMQDFYEAQAFLLLPDYKLKFSSHNKNKISKLWFVKEEVEKLGSVFEQISTTRRVSIYSFLGTEFAKNFVNEPRPKGGWSGNRHPHEASSFVRDIVFKLASIPLPEAGNALRTMLEASEFSTYQQTLQTAIHDHEQLYREANFKKPTWTEAANTLFNQKPSNIDDLASLVADHLGDLAQVIKSDNANIHKQFWNVDRYGRLADPKPENEGRDALLTLLRTRLPNYISSEPEDLQFGGKRADIACSYIEQELKLPVEIKRHYHADLWSAPEEQLYKQYMRHGERSGRGIFLVFWYGLDDKRKIPRVPDIVSIKPKSAEELASALEETLSEQLKLVIEIVVVDVSGDI